MAEMDTQQPDNLGPLPNRLPEGPGDESYTPAQWEMMKAIMNTVVPSVTRQTRIGNRTGEGTVPDEKYDKAVEHLRRTMVATPSDEALEQYLLEQPYDSEVRGKGIRD